VWSLQLACSASFPPGRPEVRPGVEDEILDVYRLAPPQGGHGDAAILAVPALAVDDVLAGGDHVAPRHVEQVGHRLLAAVHAASAHVAREHLADPFAANQLWV
jgi:hypothetical protein